MKTVGYMEGTDPILLTELAVYGIGILPLSNGADGHGKYIVHLTAVDEIALVIGYLHKFMPTARMNIKVSDMLFACKTHNIPVLAIVPRDFHTQAKEQLGDCSRDMQLVDPADLGVMTRSLLKL
jgi:hypothetical protein